MMIAPASDNLLTTVASKSGMKSLYILDPTVVGMPLV